MFEKYRGATPKQRYEMLKSEDFRLMRYRHIVDNLNDERADEIHRLSDYLEEHGFLSCPASSKRKYHLSEPGGLLRHSLWVSDTYLDLLHYYGVEMEEDSARLVSLFHDASKVGFGGIRAGDPFQPRYLERTETDKKDSGELYRYNNDHLAMVLPVSTLWLISSFVHLSAKEAQAIVAHDGMYIPENASYAHRLCPEASILCQADESSLLYERELV